jgi:hypothetical protein
VAKPRDLLVRFLGENKGLKSAAGQAESSVKGFSDRMRSVGDSMLKADGISGKFRAGLGGLKAEFGSAAGSGALLAGGVAAAATVAAKCVTAFQDLGLKIGKFRDATGTTAEEASRFVEVFEDLGVGADAGATAIGKMEKVLGANAQAFAQYGVEVVRAKDGTMDATATFVAAVDALSRIEDPAKRAEAASKIFGKSWQDLGEIIDGGAPKIKAALDGVSKAKVFDDGDIDKARELRDAMDRIRDAGESLMLTVGKDLAPAIASLADNLGAVMEVAGPVLSFFGKLPTVLSAAVGAVKTLKGAFAELGDWLSEEFDLKAAGESMADGASAVVDGVADVVDKAGDKVAGLADKMFGSGAAAKVKGLAAEISEDVRGAADAIDGIGESAPAIDSTTAAMQRFLDAGGSVDSTSAAMQRYTETTGRAAAEADRAEGAMWRQIAAMDEEAAAAKRAEDAQRQLMSAMLEMLNSDLAVEASHRRMGEAMSAAAKAATDPKVSLEQLVDAQLAARDAALSNAEAMVRQANDQATANGQTLTAAQQMDVWRRAMYGAALAAGPGGLADAIGELITKYGMLPDDPKTLKVTADTSDAEAKISNLRDVSEESKRQSIVKKVDVDTSPAQQSIADLTAAADAYARSNPTTTVAVDTAPAMAGFAAVGERAREVGAMAPVIRVDVDTSPAAAKLAALKAQIASVTSQIAALRAGSGAQT